MSVDLRAHLYFDALNINENLVKKLADSALQAGLEYHRDGDEPSLRDLIKKISGKGYGFISFKNNLGTLFFVGLSKKSHLPIRNMPEIEVSTPASAFGYYGNEKENEPYLKTFVKNARIIVEVVKNIWNSLDSKPIFGIGDFETRLYDGPLESLKPEDVTSLNIFDKIPLNFCWMNLYGSELIKKFGERKILSSVPPKWEKKIWKSVKLNKGIMTLRGPLPHQLALQKEYENSEYVKKEFERL